MKALQLPSDSLLGGWFMPPKIIDDILDFWNDSDDLKQEGVVNQNGIGEVLNKRVKDSVEIQIQPHADKEPWQTYEKYLQECLLKYIKLYKYANYASSFCIREKYNLQGYPKGGGFPDVHTENQGCLSTVHRHLVFMTYLNDLEHGGTNFPVQNITTPSKKGLTLIFPAYFTHPHNSQVCKKNKKQIVTGWYNFQETIDLIHFENP